MEEGWTYERLLDRVKRYVKDEEEIPPLFFEALSKRKHNFLELTLDEYQWLQYNHEFIRNITASELAATILLYFNTIRRHSTRRELATRLGIFDSALDRPMRKMLKMKLFNVRSSLYDKKAVIYVKNDGLTNVHKMLLDVILSEHSKNSLLARINTYRRESKSRDSNRDYMYDIRGKKNALKMPCKNYF